MGGLKEQATVRNKTMYNPLSVDKTNYLFIFIFIFLLRYVDHVTQHLHGDPTWSAASYLSCRGGGAGGATSPLCSRIRQRPPAGVVVRLEANGSYSVVRPRPAPPGPGLIIMADPTEQARIDKSRVEQ